eukprot:5371899-Alexandrium_andersonii.AAC.1
MASSAAMTEASPPPGRYTEASDTRPCSGWERRAAATWPGSSQCWLRKSHGGGATRATPAGRRSSCGPGARPGGAGAWLLNNGKVKK